MVIGLFFCAAASVLYDSPVASHVVSYGPFWFMKFAAVGDVPFKQLTCFCQGFVAFLLDGGVAGVTFLACFTSRKCGLLEPLSQKW